MSSKESDRQRVKPISIGKEARKDLGSEIAGLSWILRILKAS